MESDRRRERQANGRRWLFLLAGDAQKASSRVRGFWVADELRALGERCTLLPCIEPLRIVYAALLIPFADVVVFQKTYSKHHRRLQRLCRWLGKVTYLDIDDAPSRSNNPVTLANFRAMCRDADAVLAGNALLARMATDAGGRAERLATGIRSGSYPRREHRGHAPVRIGWIGDAGQYLEDLEQVLLPALEELAAEQAIVFRIIGARGQALGERRRPFPVERIEDLDWSSQDAVAAQLRDVDIGVYPLLANPFNDYKCGFKALEYMACGIPVIASPNPANRDIVEHEVVGFLADTPGEWTGALRALATDARLRQAQGDAGRTRVAQLYDTHIIARRLVAIADADSPGRK